MPTRVRSFSKINLGLAIGPVRPDGFHALTTLYQTLELHDVVTVHARRADATTIVLKANHEGVPADERNTAWKIVAGCLERLGLKAEVEMEIDKRLPVQGGMGAGSANAAAALIGLERELEAALGGAERLELAGQVGSDVPLFLLGGAVLGLGRGEQVFPMPDLPALECVMALPEVGVSTPAAFRDWDALAEREGFEPSILTLQEIPTRLERLSLAYSSMSAKTGVATGTSGILHGSLLEKQREGSGEPSCTSGDLAENALLELVHTGIGDGLENDFERVVFPQYPSLREIKQQLMGDRPEERAVYAALSGSGSALFGLYGSTAAAEAAQHRVQALGVRTVRTYTLPRREYWRTMIAE